MNLKEELLKGIYEYGINGPSAFQQKAIIPCIKGNLLKNNLRNVIFTFNFILKNRS